MELGLVNLETFKKTMAINWKESGKERGENVIETKN